MDNTPAKHYSGCTGRKFPPPDVAERELTALLESDKQGRLTKYTPEHAMSIINHIAAGGTIKTACEQIGIERCTFYVWRDLVPGFSHAVAHARKLQADSYVDDSVQGLENVEISPDNPKASMAVLRKAEQVARFKLDIAERMSFEQWGQKKAQLNINANVTIADGDASKWFNR